MDAMTFGSIPKGTLRVCQLYRITINLGIYISVRVFRLDGLQVVCCIHRVWILPLLFGPYMFHMLEDRIHADVTINTSGGMLKAHKAILSSSSPVFESMFLHDLEEKESSTIDADDMALYACSALLSYMYGNIKQDEFCRHRRALLGAANKCDITDLKNCCEESLLEDISSSKVVMRFQEAWLYQLPRLKKGCLTYLFDFGIIYDVREDINSFFGHADPELMLEMFQEVLTVWKPV